MTNLLHHRKEVGENIVGQGLYVIANVIEKTQLVVIIELLISADIEYINLYAIEDGKRELIQTIGENIGITLEAYDEAAVRDVAEAACLDQTVMGFAKGYETMVGERGVTLSGGQKQRTAIARTLLTKAPIMIFDDSLSAVDAETDAAIREQLKNRFGSATVILISHRITTLLQADTIMVLDQGKVAEIGSHAELVQSGGLYSKIYHLQTQGMAELVQSPATKTEGGAE